jgi:hypothetical protein
MTRPPRVMLVFEPATVVVSLWSRNLRALLLVTAMVCFVSAVWAAPIILVATVSVLGLIAAAATLSERRYRAHLQSIAKSREGESICIFARALPVRQLDAWVVRAVFEQLQSFLDGIHQGFPIRASDRLVEDLRVDLDDVGGVLLPEIAQKSGRSLTDIESNPYYGKVVTVDHLIRFFCAQASGRTRG